MSLKKYYIIILLLLNISIYSQEVAISNNLSNENNKIHIIKEKNIYKLKDIVRILGYKNNQLIGYGIVVGLNGTGDTKFDFNKQILNKILNKFNININLENYQTKNIASVLVTAEIPPFAKKGDRISCYVSSIGDAKSIENGILIQTPLYGANGRIYAVAQGKILTSKKENRFSYNNNGYIPQGAIIEKDLQELELENKVRLQLIEFDFEQLHTIYKSLKNNFKEIDFSIEGGSIVIDFKKEEELINQLNDILNLEIELPSKNKIIINRENKTIIIMGNIPIKPFVLGRLQQIEQYSKIQREAYQGIYIYTPSIKENKNFIYFNVNSLEEFVKEIQNYHFTIEEIIDIFESLIESGMFKADLIIR